MAGGRVRGGGSPVGAEFPHGGTGGSGIGRVTGSGLAVGIPRGGVTDSGSGPGAGSPRAGTTGSGSGRVTGSGLAAGIPRGGVTDSGSGPGAGSPRAGTTGSGSGRVAGFPHVEVASGCGPRLTGGFPAVCASGPAEGGIGEGGDVLVNTPGSGLVARRPGGGTEPADGVVTRSPGVRTHAPGTRLTSRFLDVGSGAPARRGTGEGFGTLARTPWSGLAAR
ncbi:hypothetical protein EV567_1520 [Streptomyces sp. BK239]|nr:hypothetical protein EV567_1520 [Streptomyces sp. BK239]